MLDTYGASFSETARMTRDETVRREGREAARRRVNRHDNPYRSRSADGISWHAGYDAETADQER
ncbi:hypothetical protein [Aureimonas sp. AU4]|uniref:hypothetical protein n=1 Tax=Aureimonas sp. AU4 TaxID=1638163 RepID=UPI000783FDBF|nr:hypothetical protein [Aureimonas sp. AU4]